MRIKIRNFGIAREICGGPLTELELPENATAELLKTRLGELFPRLAGLGAFFIAVNEEYAEPATVIFEQDEIAIIPPVSGG